MAFGKKAPANPQISARDYLPTIEEANPNMPPEMLARAREVVAKRSKADIEKAMEIAHKDIQSFEESLAESRLRLDGLISLHNSL